MAAPTAVADNNIFFIKAISVLRAIVIPDEMKAACYLTTCLIVLHIRQINTEAWTASLWVATGATAMLFSEGFTFYCPAIDGGVRSKDLFWALANAMIWLKPEESFFFSSRHQWRGNTARKASLNDIRCNGRKGQIIENITTLLAISFREGKMLRKSTVFIVMPKPRIPQSASWRIA